MLRSARRWTSKLAASLGSTMDFLARCLARLSRTHDRLRTSKSVARSSLLLSSRSRTYMLLVALDAPRSPDVWLPRSAGSRGPAERRLMDGQTTRPAFAALSHSGLDGGMNVQTCCCFGRPASAARPGGQGRTDYKICCCCARTAARSPPEARTALRRTRACNQTHPPARINLVFATTSLGKDRRARGKGHRHGRHVPGAGAAVRYF
jgi:hypothetical protein